MHLMVWYYLQAAIVCLLGSMTNSDDVGIVSYIMLVSVKIVKNIVFSCNNIIFIWVLNKSFAIFIVKYDIKHCFMLIKFQC